MLETLYYAADPPAYAATGHKSQGLFLAVGEGVSLLDYDVRGISAPYCTYAAGIGMLDESASLEAAESLIPINLSMSIIEGGTLETQTVPGMLEGFTPLRAFFLSAPVGRDIPGGKTLSRVEVVSDCQDKIHVNVLRKATSRDPFQSKTWVTIMPHAQSVGLRTSGLEFMIMLYVKGGGRFRIFRVTAWFKLTDRRGIYSFGGLPSDNAGSADQGA